MHNAAHGVRLLVLRSQSKAKLDPLDEAAGLDGAGEQVARGVVVPDPEGNLDALGVDEVHPTRQRDSGHAAGGGRKGGKRRWKILDVAPRLYIIDVGRRELVVQALHQFIVHRLGDVLHRAWLSPIAVRQVRGHSSADRWTMHTQVSNVPAGVTSHNVTVARAYTKLMGAFVTFQQTTDSLGECRNLDYQGPARTLSTWKAKCSSVPPVPDRQLK